MRWGRLLVVAAALAMPSQASAQTVFEGAIHEHTAYSDGEPGTRPAHAFRRWAAIAEQADAATDSSFVGVRGFEWTNDRHGHINVLFSRNYTNAKVDLGYLSMDFFWRWFTKPPSLGGGADGLGTFNHPSRRTIGDILPGGLLGFLPPAEQPGTQWDDFRHVPAADRRMVGMELFN